MNNTKTLIITGLMALFSTSAMAAPIPGEIFKPRGAEVVKADRQGDGEFEAEFRLHDRDTSVKHLAGQVRAHAQRHGFKVVESEVKRDDADLKFKRRNQELDVSIERKDHGVIEYKADLDSNR
ncbi:hypothetical protein BWD09_04175 [Neisseria dentiae]|uniref:PepSY domain-containing protein n=1 Tax=Neisseria dentiae TaxID=194197 RepID=A0A1X3DDQ5_9NEIS|nr:hypothetical protein [Neisseria dentiae]OSI17956.1 hypothetical protein BWD09_04175 [Neisseria dentiae]QMT45094.1 hypothetical protein H3L92_11950 [Neisseria dentiae]STZ50848.1 Uncharacterised protein [Neisseria dentiae]